MADFLLELFSEEIPARMQAKARADLERLFAAQLANAGLKADSITTYSTPRRLALIAIGLPAETEAVREETKGPPTAAPDQAIEGFLRKVGLSRDELEVRDLKGRDTYFAVIDKPGRPTADILGPAITAIIRDFPWPKSMRWGKASASSESLRWVRPLHRIVAMLGGDVVPVEIEGVGCGAASLGHRFHHPGEITFAGASDYVEKLRMAHVLVDHEEREGIVRDGAKKLAAEAGYDLIEDEGLVIENSGLTEWPVPLLGRFDPDFLDVPPEVIQKTARADQKYFVMTDGEKLAPAFVCTANLESSDPQAVIEGNQKVLAARLSDARFFWENDLKVPLESLGDQLADIVFHEKLGTVADKVDRVARLARWLAEEKIVDADPDTVERAARLSKNDLVTELVGEYGELQGLIGGYLAHAQGESDEIADAIRDHYKPVGQGDDVPTAPVTVAVSLADKLDSLRAFFGIDEKPTGSKDPFALRRSALGAIRLIEENDLRLSVAEGDLLDFFADRLKVQQKEAGVRHDLIDAVFALEGEDDLVRILSRVKALQAFVETDAGTDLLAAYKRASNILKKEGVEGSGSIPGTLEQTGEEDPLALVGESAAFDRAVAEWDHETLQGEEAALADALVKAGPVTTQALNDEEFTAAMAALASLRGPIDAFFEEVMVVADDADVKARRLGLLARFRSLVDGAADFSKIEG
ncbi:glycine--tRNA ligase subunit beta [Sphingomicrobium sediminis]|uniref:Glycine--tRNA ligase beta subunit n=1 Tax=Sphingomicrobium sediminis TaxID=2950949 RepID=A0A9X2J1D0_9SPHN|nr:glycine--tRNA ligase subunit beta [Sphingomicrobium sediminis]MCM8557123.1 glycine--tRNA ligase subunit beta [Sphingomicrobium sediminis]